MQKNRLFTIAGLALVIGVLAVSIGTIINLIGTIAFALAPGNHTGGRTSGSTTGTNNTSSIMCTPHYPC